MREHILPTYCLIMYSNNKIFIELIYKLIIYPCKLESNSLLNPLSILVNYNLMIILMKVFI